MRAIACLEEQPLLFFEVIMLVLMLFISYADASFFLTRARQPYYTFSRRHITISRDHRQPRQMVPLRVRRVIAVGLICRLPMLMICYALFQHTQPVRH